MSVSIFFHRPEVRYVNTQDTGTVAVSIGSSGSTRSSGELTMLFNDRAALTQWLADVVEHLHADERGVRPVSYAEV